LLIRQATQEDVSSIAELEKSVSSPWSVAQIAAEIAYSAAILLISSKGISGTITGWCSLRLMAPEAELLKISVHPSCRRSGLGKQLLKEALKRSAATGCREIFLEVRAKNHPARNLYHQFGFKEHGVRKNYYDQPGDDAILYRGKIDSLMDNHSCGAI
jgi:ribosomal-protein-alanine acetyltransferase